MGKLSYEKAFRKQLKKSYKGLTKEQKEYIKAKETLEQADKELSRFYRTAKRTSTGAVDFEHIEDEDLNWFEHINKVKTNSMKKMEKLEHIIDINYTLTLFLEINTHSQSY